MEASEWFGGAQKLVAGNAALEQSKRKAAVTIAARSRANKGAVHLEVALLSAFAGGAAPPVRPGRPGSETEIWHLCRNA